MEIVKKVGVWIRVSTEGQVKDESPEHHEQRARYYASAKGWEIVEVYRLDAVSGKSVMEQPETKRMLKDVKNGKISGLIFSKLARLARNTKELLEFADIFKVHNADLISLAESIDTSTPAGRLFYTMIAAMATWEREEIAERVAASVPIRAKLGKPLSGSAPFGYKWVNKEFVVDEKEAPIRKLMYEIFLRTKRKKATARELTELGYRTRNGNKFSNTVISRMLRDTCSIGVRRANYTTGDGIKVTYKPQSEWIEIPCPAIISVEVWEECNRILNEQESKKVINSKKTKHLLAGYVYCSCDLKMYVYTEAPVYKCRKCGRKIAVADLDEIYYQYLKEFLPTSIDLSKFNTNAETTISEKEILLKNSQTELSKLRKRLQEAVTMRLDGDLSREDLQAVYKPMQERMRQLEAQLPELEAEIDFLKIQYLSSETIVKDAEELYKNWPTLPFEEKRSLIEIITQKITIGKSDIHIQLAYEPTPQLPLPKINCVKGEHNRAVLFMH